MVDPAIKHLTELASGNTREQREHDAVSQLVALTNRELTQPTDPKSRDERAVNFLAELAMNELKRQER